MKTPYSTEAYSFVAYLWGIETFPLWFTSGKSFKFVAYLWGIETCWRWCSLWRSFHVCSLPMRNWNHSRGRRWTDIGKVCSLPMRNWNDHLWAANQRRVAKFVAYLWGIETLFDEPIGSRGRGVCSLPMRNWNPGGWRTDPLGRKFVAYLWGIETWIPTVPLGQWDLFVAYLWGIETEFLPHIPESPHYVCSLPMRNWNRSWFLGPARIGRL